MAFRVLVSKQFLLDRKVAPDAVEITDEALAKELLSGIGEEDE